MGPCLGKACLDLLTRASEATLQHVDGLERLLARMLEGGDEAQRTEAERSLEGIQMLAFCLQELVTRRTSSLLRGQATSGKVRLNLR